MIKRLNSTELSTAKPRAGFQHVSGVIERLMQMYQMQTEMNEMRDKEIRAEQVADQQIAASTKVLPVAVEVSVASAEQSTFGWE